MKRCELVGFRGLHRVTLLLVASSCFLPLVLGSIVLLVTCSSNSTRIAKSNQDRVPLELVSPIGRDSISVSCFVFPPTSSREEGAGVGSEEVRFFAGADGATHASAPGAEPWPPVGV